MGNACVIFKTILTVNSKQKKTMINYMKSKRAIDGQLYMELANSAEDLRAGISLSHLMKLSEALSASSDLK